MRPRSRRQAGFTLIEILLAVSLLAFLFVVMGVAYLASERAWKQGQEKLLVQTEATYALEQIARDIRAARTVALVTADELVCYGENGAETVRYTFGEVGGVYHVLRSGTPVMEQECTRLNFAYDADAGVVLMEMEFIDDQENRVRVDSKANLRNRNLSAI